MARIHLVALALLAVAGSSCHEGGSNSAPTIPMVLAAGMDGIGPISSTPAVPVDLGRLGLSRVDRAYRLTTPADTPFCFDVLTRATGNVGPVRVAVAHAADNGREPSGSVDSLADVGCIPSATGITRREMWLDAFGDGFARMTLRGKITSNQILAFETRSNAGATIALVEIAIGPESAINRAAHIDVTHPGVIQNKTIYSSNSWQFGLPTIAVSGDRTSLVAYEGDRKDEVSPRRYEMRLQHDHKTDKVTGGGSVEASADSGHWRDHEIAALFNVLALAHSGTDRVTLKLSFDRGATFEQEVSIGYGNAHTRLVQVAMAADYSLAVLFWRSTAQHTELVLVEGRPSAADTNGSPVWFSFDPPQSLFQTDGDAAPLLTGVAWSEGGDLVVGHASTSIRPGPNLTWVSTTEFWCSVRPWLGTFVSKLLDKDVMVGRDPSVAVLGKGAGLRVFYAYEGLQGLRLRVSNDAGATFSEPVTIGTPGAHTPTLFARKGAEGGTRVDVVYLTNGTFGSELHLTRWLDFGKSSPEHYRLTTSKMERTDAAQEVGNQPSGPTSRGYRLTHVAWFGYDAVLDGDEIVVVYDEESFESASVFLLPWNLGWGGGGGIVPPTALNSPVFRPATPPPLAPGMTKPVPTPVATHRHQLKLLRLD